MRKFVVVIATVAICVLPTAAARAASFSDVFFFGTSELDTGNWLLHPTLSSHALAPTADKGYWNGRWQEGPAWSDYFAALLGHDATASRAGGQNYAYGVAWLGPLATEPAPTPGTLAAIQDLYFSSQITAALSDAGGVLPSDALYVISIGSNDDAVFGKPVDQADDRANLAVSEIERLVNAGARSFLVQTLGTNGGANLFAVNYNNTLLAGLGGIPGIDVSVVSTVGFNQTVVAAPDFLANFGLTDFNTCVGDPACLAAAITAATSGTPFLGNTHFRFDTIHRNTRVAEALAQYAAAQLPDATVPEPATLSLLAAGVGAALIRRRTRR